MIKKLILLLVPMIALIAGSLGGAMMRPASETDIAAPGDDTAEHGDGGVTAAHGDDGHAAPEGGNKDGEGTAQAWFRFPNQFFVPLTRNGDMGAMMILTLTLETTETGLPDVERQEHRLRDVLLRHLLIAANTGLFDGNYTADARLTGLRADLLKAVQKASVPQVSGVLIEDVARKDG